MDRVPPHLRRLVGSKNETENATTEGQTNDQTSAAEETQNRSRVHVDMSEPNANNQHTQSENENSSNTNTNSNSNTNSNTTNQPQDTTQAVQQTQTKETQQPQQTQQIQQTQQSQPPQPTQPTQSDLLEPEKSQNQNQNAADEDSLRLQIESARQQAEQERLNQEKAKREWETQMAIREQAEREQLLGLPTAQTTAQNTQNTQKTAQPESLHILEQLVKNPRQKRAQQRPTEDQIRDAEYDGKRNLIDEHQLMERLVQDAKRKAALLGVEKASAVTLARVTNPKQASSQLNSKKPLGTILSLLSERAISMSLEFGRLGRFSLSEKVLSSWTSVMQQIIVLLDKLEPIAMTLLEIAEGIQERTNISEGNGLQSLLSVLHSCLCQFLDHFDALDDIILSPTKLLFKAPTVLEQSQESLTALSALQSVLAVALLMANKLDCSYLSGVLLKPAQAALIQSHAKEQDLNFLYTSKAFGFQYTGKLGSLMQGLATMSASHTYGFDKGKSDMSKMFYGALGMPQMMNKSHRGSEIQRIQLTDNDPLLHRYVFSQNQTFFYNFVNQSLPPIVEENRSFEIDCSKQVLVIEKNSTKKITVASIASSPFVRCRLISKYIRATVSGVGPQGLPLSRRLIIYFSGGEFFSLSDRSQERFLRSWAELTQVPIFVVEYNTSPESTFPEALNQSFFAYAWALANGDKLGTKAEHIVVCGDSAGGHVALGVAVRAGLCGLRKPDGVVLLYPHLHVQPTFSFSRLLSLLDPVLPFGMLQSAHKAYCGAAYTPTVTPKQQQQQQQQPPPPQQQQQQTDTNQDAAQDPLLSPLLLPTESLSVLPPVHVMVGEFDPLLDDSVVLVSQLRRAGKSAKFLAVKGCCHSFMHLAHVEGPPRDAFLIATEWIRAILQL